MVYIKSNLNQNYFRNGKAVNEENETKIDKLEKKNVVENMRSCFRHGKKQRIKYNIELRKCYELAN